MATVKSKHKALIPPDLIKEWLAFRDLLRMDLGQKPWDDTNSLLGKAFKNLNDAWAKHRKSCQLE